MGVAAVELRAVTAGYGRRTALRDVSLTVDDGVLVVVGPNGGGKSTLLKLMATLLAPSAGSVHVMGAEVAGRHGLRTARRSLGYLEQDARFPPELRVLDCLRYAAWLFHVPRDECVAAVQRAVDAFDLGVVTRDRLGQLSGGTRQRVMLAAASIHRPHVLVLDEPTSGVDPIHRVAIQSMLAGDALAPARIVSTHHLDDVVAIADRIVVVVDGSIGFDGSLGQLEAIGGASGDPVRSLQAALAGLGSRSHTRPAGV